VHEFGFNRAKAAFHRGIVPTIFFVAHGLEHADYVDGGLNWAIALEKTPLQTLLDAIRIAREKLIAPSWSRWQT